MVDDQPLISEKPFKASAKLHPGHIKTERQLVENYTILNSSCRKPGGLTDQTVTKFLDFFTTKFGFCNKIGHSMRIFVIDIDKLECTVFGNKKPYRFNNMIHHWKIKAFDSFENDY